MTTETDGRRAGEAALAAADRAARAAALDPQRSVIVQAPAGSGKTELLAQRVLALLARAAVPEELVAITFTRKAAAEMRHRILAALRSAGSEPPEEDHARQTWLLARAALARDRELGWNLLEHPSRLAVQTFDSLCASLARQLPVTSRLGTLPAIAEKPKPLHVEAAWRTLGSAGGDAELADSWQIVLQHLDNDVGAVVALLGEMLGRRDQWLGLVTGNADLDAWRRALEAALAAEIEWMLELARAVLPGDALDECLALARASAPLLEDPGAREALLRAAAGPGLPGTAPSDVASWMALADFLLTAKGDLRRKVDKTRGFPRKDGAPKALGAEFAARKCRMHALLERLATDPRRAPTLHRVRSLPAARYADAQWAVVAALLRLLERGAAELDVLFAERGQSDFAGVAIAAQRALGTADAPTDLLQALDYRIRHLLVDEFQDTSRAQFELLVTLTAGWEPDDGRTLFLVGDPMQSIYRFRQAEVALFARAQARGLGTVTPEPQRLAFNFRSVPAIVRWVNDTFSSVFARVPDTTIDHIDYAQATPWREGDGGVRFHLVGSPEEEAARVAALVLAARRDEPQGTVAVLVRSRTHLAEVVPALRAAGLSFQAVEIDALSERQAVLDLAALAQALRHPADRHSWLALLRGPLVGLSLPELLAVAGDHPNGVCDRIVAWASVPPPGAVAADAEPAIGADARVRLSRFATVAARALAARGREPFARLVEATWLALGGAEALDSDGDLVAAGQFFAELRAFESSVGAADWQAFRERIGALYAPPDPGADGRLQLLTIHKAKGLQFDTVIVPGITRGVGKSDPQLLRWRSGADGALLLAPIGARDDRDEPIHGHLKALAAADDDAELGRLLYVAATRARQVLHWVGSATEAQRAREQGYQPPAKTLLARLWPAVAAEVSLPEAVSAAGAQGESGAGSTAASLPPVRTDPAPGHWLRRFPAVWTPVPLGPDVSVPAAAELRVDYAAQPPFDWAREIARHVGTVAHRYLLQIAQDGLGRWDADRLAAARTAIGVRLREHGVTGGDLEPAIERVFGTLRRALADPRGRWVLGAGHRDPRSELALSARLGDSVVRVVVDRTFIDAQGTRWIIDFKTGTHEGADLEAFLDSERERYRAQLEAYARVLAALREQPIRLALYYPGLGGWREWPAAAHPNPL